MNRTPGVPQFQVARGLCAHGSCSEAALAECPVPLCGKHLREVYQFAQDLIADGWDTAVRDYVSDLHSKFSPPRKVLKHPRPGHVYFIRLGNMVKVGFSEVPMRRLKALPHEEVIGVVLGSRDDEHAWHVMLAEYRAVGEWFRAEPEVLEAIRRVCQAQAV